MLKKSSYAFFTFLARRKMNESEITYAFSGSRLQNTQSERDACQKSLASYFDEERSCPCHVVVIVSLRQRLLDEDNLFGGCKFLIDCMRPHLIPDDAPHATAFKVKQVKVSKPEEECTLVQITYREI